jgi:tetratricopeptide (TPR) repeat protein
MYMPIGKEGMKSDSIYYPSHTYKASAVSNVDTNNFINTSKSEEKNRLMPERHLKKLFQVSGDDSIKIQVGLRENISFDKNTQVLSAMRNNNSATNKQSNWSHFTFNSTEKQPSQDLESMRNQNAENDHFTIKNFANRLINAVNSQQQDFSGPSTFEGNREGYLEQKNYPIMNSVRQFLQKNSDRSVHLQNHLLDPQSSVKTVESKDSTKVIRERLKNKIDNLRERISNSHKETLRSIPENLNFPLNRISQWSERQQQPIDTMRVHSRDGSKSIEGSGLELDEYVEQYDDPQTQIKVNQFKRMEKFSGKYDTFNSINHHNESMHSANTFQSKWKDYTESMKNQNISHQNRKNICSRSRQNNTFQNQNQIDNYFTLEDVQNPKDTSSRNHISIDVQPVQRRSKKPLRHSRTHNYTSTLNKAKKKQRTDEKSSFLNSKKKEWRSTNSSFTRAVSRSGNKIQPYRKSSKKRSKKKKMNNTGNVMITGEESEFESQINSSRQIDSRIERVDTEAHQQPLHSLINEHLSKVDISPKRHKSYYKKKRKNSLIKPSIKPYNHSSEKINKSLRPHQLPPRYKSSTVIHSSEKQRSIRLIMHQKEREMKNGKITKKIFKQISEWLSMLEQDRDYNKILSKLIVIDKLWFTTFEETDVICVFVKYLMIFWYYKCQDYDRWVRQIEMLTKRVFEFYKKRKLKRETANLLLQVHKMWGDVQMIKQRFDKAAQIYTELIGLYSIWRSWSYRTTSDFWIDYQEYEFTDDNILEVKSSWGEALMHMGETFMAIEKFEEAKSDFQKIIIFTSELVFINICNQLANWYIKINKKDKALENFELSKSTIESWRNDLQIDTLILAKILSNMASIYLEKENFSESITLYQSSLKLKRQKLPEHHQETLSAYSNLGDWYLKAQDPPSAYDWYDHAYEISKHLFGKQHKTTATLILHWARWKLLTEDLTDSAKLFEYSCKLFAEVEGGLGKQGRLSKLKLMEVYGKMGEEERMSEVVKEIMGEIEKEKQSEERSKFLNDLGNLVKKYGDVDMAIKIYRMALIGAKTSVAKILMNLSEAYSLIHQPSQAAKYLSHALRILNDLRPMANSEAALTQLKLAKAQSEWGEIRQALRNYQQGIDVLEAVHYKHSVVDTWRKELDRLRKKMIDY